ncbi:MAG TPA: peptidase S10, partial [Terriglobales bacterium]|nr:peptidase S10 [Terriglobales bacterium]
NGKTINYTATVAQMPLKDASGETEAHIFYVAYTLDGADDKGKRPLTFAFNGGPGSASLWVHMGAMGPRSPKLMPNGNMPPPPYQMKDNPYTWLDVTDLVFIDPVSTGYSRPAAGQEAKQFHGLREDLESVGEFIRLHTSRAGRWASPKFLVGESYGTTRAAGLTQHLAERHGMHVSGVGLISAILMFQSVRPDPGNDLPYVLSLPTYAATGWYHRRLDRRFTDLRALTDEVEEFALGDYASLLLQGGRTPEATRRSVAERLASYTALSAAFLEACDLRVAPHRFFKELLRSERRTVGRLDTRFTGIDSDAAGEAPQYDPSYMVIQAPFTAAVNAHLRGELGFESDLPYEVLRGESVRPWNYGDDGTNHYVDVASMLRAAMSWNRDLRVLLASGCYDMATPFAAAEWTFDHMGLDPTLAGNVRMTRYEAGHMMYINPPSRDRLARELRALVTGSAPADS